jgi:hypothetical protein
MAKSTGYYTQGVGYGGSGWTYPLASRGQAPVTYSTTRPPTYAATGQPVYSPVAAAIADGGGGGGGSDGGGGGTAAPFDFSTDPGYLAALAAEQTGSAQADAALRAARISALVNFGDPSLASAFGVENLDPLTAAMAQQATTSGISTLAQLQRSRDLTQANTVNQLAAHGLIRSGDLGWRTGQNQQDYATSLYNAQQGVLNTLAGVARDTAAQKQQLQTNTVGALTSAYNTYIANPQYYGMAQTPITQAPAAAAATTAAAPTYAPPPAPKPTVARAPVSRLAAPNPYRFQTARNVAMG